MPYGVNRYTIAHSITLALWLWIFGVLTYSHLNNTWLTDDTILMYLKLAMVWSIASFIWVFHNQPNNNSTKTALGGLSFIQASSIGCVALCAALAYVWTFSSSSTLDVINATLLFLVSYIILYFVITDK
ncbi:MAG: hypothetical protein HYV33_01130 [Candidatus Kerfeldbacteria bacterium]|nr:hypothetical protein [Candidatus Kerfeldbacteria bacterium]